MNQRPWEIYTLSDPRSMAVRYVGVTFRQKQRYNEHISRAITGGKTHRDCWIRSLIAAGIRPLYQTIQSGIGEGWQDAERHWIAFYRSRFDLTNLTDGGDGTPGIIPSPELREKWSKMRAGTKYAPGRVSAMKGKKHTPEAVEKIRKAGSGRKHSAQSKAKLSAIHTGKTLSEDHRQKLSVAHSGKTLSENHKQKIAATTPNRKAVLCVETGQIFPSITEAAKTLGVSEASINQAIRKGVRCKGNHLRFV